MTTKENEFDSNYRYVLVAARRARQLLSGAQPAVETNSRKPCKIAMEEIRAGKVHWGTPQAQDAPAEPAGESPEEAGEPEKQD